MAKNDLVLLDGILEQLQDATNSSMQPDEVFEYFAFEQVLKDFDLSTEEIESGWVDGRDDGGLDGFFIFVNGHLVQDPENFPWPKTNASIEVWLISAKRRPTFQQAPINAIFASIQELFDLSLEPEQFKAQYSDELLAARSIFYHAYRSLSVVRPQLQFRFLYVSRGDSEEAAKNVGPKAAQVTNLMESFFSSCSASFDFVGAQELVTLYRRTKSFSLELPFVEHLAAGTNSYALLVSLDKYYRFVSDTEGQLRRYLFDSNVRDYLGDARVNGDISASLCNSEAPDFWWLNNGVTILATNATVIGKTIQLQDIQIVNGLQTTETIYRHFQSSKPLSTERCLLVKVIVSTDPLVRDQIIRATNNQSVVELSSLHATDKIQQDIEKILERHGWFYERRKNYYRNIGKPASHIITPMYVATGVVALVMKNPAVAARLKTRFMQNQLSYESVFSKRYPLQIWPIIVSIMKRVDEELDPLRPEPGLGERFLANWRGLVSFLVVARLCQSLNYSVTQLIEIEIARISKELVVEVWSDIQSVLQADGKKRSRNPEFVLSCCKVVSQNYGLGGLAAVGVQQIPFEMSKYNRRYVPPELVDQVDELLPIQPWKPGVHKEVAAKLGCKPPLVDAAIQELIYQGRRYNQRDGVVFDAER